jgi:integrase/ribosomal protein L40E
MAIQIFCLECKTSNALTAKTCSKCGAVFTRDKKYRVCVSVKGQRVTRLCDNLTIARETESAIKGDMVRGEFDIAEHRAGKPITLGDVWKKYLPYIKEHNRSWKCDEYNYGAHLEARFSKKPLGEITPFDIEKMKIELSRETNKNGKPYAAQSVKHYLALLRRLYKAASRWGLYQGASPMDKVKMPCVDNERTDFLSDEEVRRLMETLESWHCRESVAFVKFALFTGMRRGEIMKLEWTDIQFDRGMITLKNPKGGKTTTIPVSDAALDVLRELPITTTCVFPGKDGKPRTDFKGPWLRIRKAAGLPDNFRFHALRHHFASTLVSNGVNLAVVKELLTHKDMSTTQRYAHLAPSVVQEAAKRSAELLQPKPKADVIDLKR